MQVTMDRTPRPSLHGRKSDVIQSVRAAATELALEYFNAMNRAFMTKHFPDYEDRTMEDMYFKGEIGLSVVDWGDSHAEGYMTLTFGEGDEGGPSTIHVIYDVQEWHVKDYKAWHAKGMKGKPKSLGHEVIWTIRSMLWDFDTMIGPFYNYTTAQEAKPAEPHEDPELNIPARPEILPWVCNNEDTARELVQDGQQVQYETHWPKEADDV